MPQGETHCSTVHLSPLTCWRVSWSWSSFPCPKASINEQHICQEDHLWILIWCAVLDASSNDQCCHLGCVAGAVFACGDLRCLLLSTWVLHKHSSSSVPHNFYCRHIYVCRDPWSLRELYFRDSVGAFLQWSLCLCWELDLKTWIQRTDTQRHRLAQHNRYTETQIGTKSRHRQTENCHHDQLAHSVDTDRELPSQPVGTQCRYRHRTAIMTSRHTVYIQTDIELPYWPVSTQCRYRRRTAIMTSWHTV